MLTALGPSSVVEVDGLVTTHSRSYAVTHLDVAAPVRGRWPSGAASPRPSTCTGCWCLGLDDHTPANGASIVAVALCRRIHPVARINVDVELRLDLVRAVAGRARSQRCPACRSARSPSCCWPEMQVARTSAGAGYLIVSRSVFGSKVLHLTSFQLPEFWKPCAPAGCCPCGTGQSSASPAHWLVVPTPHASACRLVVEVELSVERLPVVIQPHGEVAVLPPAETRHPTSAGCSW